MHVVGAVCTDGGSAVVRASVGSGGAAFSVAVDVVVRVSVKSGGTVFEVACLFSDSVSDDLGSTAVAESVDRDAGTLPKRTSAGTSANNPPSNTPIGAAPAITPYWWRCAPITLLALQ